MEDLVKVKAFNLVGGGERGKTYDFSIRDTANFVFIERKAGTISGNTYHTGKSKATNPKLFVLLNGEIYFRYRHINTTEHTTLKVTAPSIIEVVPYVTHSVEGITDFLMLECNSILDIQDDRTREEVIIKDLEYS